MALNSATANLILRHRTFVGPAVYWNFRPLNQNRERIRAQAEAFVDEIGAENVVSVVEHAAFLGGFTVVVWYQAPSAAERNAAADGGA